MKSFFGIAFSCTAALIASAAHDVVGFQVSSPYVSSRKSECSALASSTGGGNQKLNTAEFEYQELKIQLDAMEKQDVPSSQLQQDKKTELEGYVQRIVRNRPSSIRLQDLQQDLPNTKWRLAFSTQSVTSDLPRDATVFLDFSQQQGQLEYCLEFTKKTLGLNRIAAKSSYTVDSSFENPGLVTYIYDEITTDIFGLRDIGVGFFGLLKGRSNYIQTLFFDGKVWIDGGVEQTPDGGTLNEYYNVYTLVD